jgi:hypothetical protein
VLFVRQLIKSPYLQSLSARFVSRVLRAMHRRKGNQCCQGRDYPGQRKPDVPRAQKAFPELGREHETIDPAKAQLSRCASKLPA